MHSRGHGRKIRRYMVLKSVFANVVQQLLQLGNFDHARTAESLQRIVRKSAFANVAANFAADVVSRETREAHLLRTDQPTQVPKVFSLPTVPAMIS